MSAEVIRGDCLEVMPTLTEKSFDAIITDPPYGLKFMGKGWDRGVPGVAYWTEAKRVLKDGCYLLAFGGTRTFHRLAVAIEDAGFEIQDTLSWLYGSGFPKHKSKLKPAHEPIIVGRKPLENNAIIAILAHTTRELICRASQPLKVDDSHERTDTFSFGLLLKSGFWNTASSLLDCLDAISEHASTFTTSTATSLITDLRILKSCLSQIIPADTTEGASRTNGDESDAFLAAAISRSVIAKCERLTATTAGETAIGWLASEGIDPEVVSDAVAWEPIIMARKPAAKATLLNIDACRIEATPYSYPNGPKGNTETATIYGGGKGLPRRETPVESHPAGRWPANVLLDERAAELLDEQSGISTSTGGRAGHTGAYGGGYKREYYEGRSPGLGDTGGASRFFYTAKASRSERNAGLEGFPLHDKADQSAWGRTCNVCGCAFVNPNTGKPKCGHDDFAWTQTGKARNHHPTVKPVELMRWLCRLVTPPNGCILDPFTGSGSTGVAATLEGLNFVGIEKESDYAEIARKRITETPPSLFGDTAA